MLSNQTLWPSATMSPIWRISDPAESSGASMSAFDLPQRSFVADHDIQVDVLP